MKKTLLYILLIFSVLFEIQAQELYYLEEGFENPESISRWSIDPIIPSKGWKYTYGGQWQSGGDPYNPEIPIQGSFNAGLYFPSLDLDTVKLISPQLELGAAKKPTLRFWHCQYEKLFKGPDFLRLFFRVSPNSEWELINDWSTDISFWKDEVYDIEDIDEKYLTDSFQLAFEGIIGNGYGVYVDSVTVREDTIVQKFVKNTIYKSAEYSAIPAGATDIPLEEIVIRVLGNSGSAILDSLTILPSGEAVGNLETASFKLFYTNNDVFAPFKNDTSTLVATAALSGGKVVFSDIGYNMALGDNHFWVAASFTSSLTGQKSLKFTIPAQGINVSDTLFPSGNTVLDGTHIVEETIFYEDFESGGAGWTLDSNFEIGWPEGTQVSTQKNPESSFNGTNILATDLDGGYFANITSGSEYYAYSPELDLKYYVNPRLYMHTFFAINGPDDAVIEMSVNGGSSWQNIWTSDASSNNSSWSEFYEDDLLVGASRKSQFQLRFGISESKTVPWPGLSIDNFAILAEKLNTDVGITEVLLPFDDCIDCGNDTVRIWVRNYADAVAPASIPVYFGLWGVDSLLVYDTIQGGISKDDSTLFTFAKTANFPQGDFYDKFIVGIDLSGDQDPSNDTLTKALVIQKNNIPPHSENFEYKGGIWLPSEESTWRNKNMSGTITTDPLSPNIWVLSPNGNYANNDTSFVISGCFDLSEASRNILQFKYWSDSELGKDGARIEYSIDDELTWNILEDPIHNSAWNWTTNNVTALSSNGWSGLNEWTIAKALIPLAAESIEKVKFRVMFMSDAVNAQPQGFAFNDMEIYSAPVDVGVSTIEIPKDTCQFTYPDEMQIWVKNYGYNDLKTNDTVIVAYDFESDAAIIDTFLLASDLIPGDSVVFNIATSFDVSAVGAYQLKAYTLIEDDPFFYGTNNDTLVKAFEIWPLPLTGLLDTISSRQPDTLMIEPVFDADYTYLWGDNTTTPTYDVQLPGTYHLTVTEVNNGCKAYDSTFVELLFNDVGIDSIISPQSSCDPSSGNTVEVLIRNFGTDSLRIDDKILLFYEFDGEPIVKDSITLTEALLSGATIPFEFTGSSVDMNLEKNYSLKVFTDYGGDTISNNDTIERTLTIFGNPELNLGADTIINGLSHNLIVDPSFDSYIWENGDTNSTRLIDTSGYYSLDIIDQNGCPASDDIDIWFRIRDLRVQSLLSPESSCNREGMDMVTIRVENYGSDTIFIADDIFVSYKLDEGTRESESFNVTQLLPGETADHSFSQNVDITAFATYSFNLTASTAGDMRPANDTLIDEVVSNTNPIVDLGIEDTDIHYVSELVLDAGAGANFAYLWQDGSTNQTYTVTDITNVNVLVTDTETGCSGSDEAFVYLDILDYTVTDVDIDASACLGNYNDVRVTLLNNGNLPRGGAEITLDYSLNGMHLFTEIYEREDNWQDGVSYIHNTQGTISLSELGSSELIVSITSDGDLRPENDDYVNAMVVDDNPEVDLGGDRQEVDFPHTLDAGPGHAAYLWSTGETTSSISATSAGTYSVTVTGTTSCQTIKSVYIDTELALSPNAEEEMSISIYPNPATEFINLEASFVNPGGYRLEVFNTQNTVLFEREINTYQFKEEFYVGNLPPGMYFIRFRKEGIYHISKMIIQ